MTFEKHLRSVSRAASQRRLGILRVLASIPRQIASWEMLSGFCTVLFCLVLYCSLLFSTVLFCSVQYCTVLFCLVLYCSVLFSTVLFCSVQYCTVLFCLVLYCYVLQCGGRLHTHHLQQLDHEVSGASFLTGGVFKCDIAHLRSVAVLCMLYKIRCNPTHPLYRALTEPYAPVRVTLSAVIVHRYTYAPSRCRTPQYRRTFIILSVSLWNTLGDTYSMVSDLRVSRARPMPLYWPSCSLPFSLLLFSQYQTMLWFGIVELGSSE